MAVSSVDQYCRMLQSFSDSRFLLMCFGMTSSNTKTLLKNSFAKDIISGQNILDYFFFRMRLKPIETSDEHLEETERRYERPLNVSRVPNNVSRGSRVISNPAPTILTPQEEDLHLKQSPFESDPFHSSVFEDFGNFQFGAKL